MNTHSPLDPIRAAWSRRKWLVIPAFAFPLAAAATLILAMPTIYRSSATLIIERQQVPETFVRPTVTDEIGMRLQTISEAALSHSRLESLITQFDLYSEFRDRDSMEEIIRRARRDIKIAPSATLPGTPRVYAPMVRGDWGFVAFSVSFQGSDAKTVADVANALASFFVDENRDVRERQASGATQFLEAELARTKQSLDEQERRVSEFNRRHVGELPSQLTANLATLEGLNSQLRLHMESQTRTSERRNTLAKLLVEETSLMAAASASAAAPAPDPRLMDPVRSRFLHLRQELAIARARLIDAHPTVDRLKAEIAALERQFGDRLAESSENPTGGPAEVASRSAETAILNSPQLVRLRGEIAEIDVQIKTLKTQEEQLTRAIAMYRARVENTPRVEQELQELSRDYASNKELYQSLVKRYEEARLAANMEHRQKGEQIRLLDSAVPGNEVAAPKRFRLLLMALVLSGGLAVGVLMLAEMLDTSFHTVDQLREFTRVPVLTSIPRIVTDRDRRRRRWRVGLGTASAVAGLALVVAICYVAAHGNEQLVRMLVSVRT
jgi:succinoglycan biosynthesis transport protein ExoP